MSSIDKLAIRGIRSFDHQELSVMQFFTPLTVIVGHNGSGKTTIIECLKYATTGDLPPNTKGGAFVHDPSIAGTSEVKAQVKLRFFNTQKQKMLVDRRLQVTKKKGTVSGLTMKTLEGTLSFVDEDGKEKNVRGSLSTKCAALDEEVPMQFGVSKAILENVIFCHQEESNWPLSEPTPLKKKFDDIFEATKYTKALDEIKLLRKAQAIEIKVDKEKLAALRTDRDRAAKLRSVIDKLASTIEVKQSDHDILDKEIVKLSAENKQFYNQAIKYTEIINKADTLRTQRDIIEENLGQTRATLIELKDSDQELMNKITNHKTDLQTLRDERLVFAQKLGDETDALSAFERKRSSAQTAHGKLLAEKQRHQETVEYRQQLIQEISGRHQIPGYDHNLSAAEMSEFEDKLDEAIGAQQRKIEANKAEAREMEQERLRTIQGLQSAQAADERTKRGLIDSIKSTNARIASITRQLENSSTTVADITLKEGQLAEEKKRKKDVEAAVKLANYQQQVSLETRRLRDLDERREQLHGELTSLNTQADVRAKLQLKRTETKRKDEAIQSLLDKHAGSFRRFTKTDPVRETMEAEVNAVFAQFEAELGGAERASKEASRELQTVETSVNFTKNKLKEVTQAAADAKRKIVEGLKALEADMETVEESIKDAEEQVGILREFVANAQGFGKFYGKLLADGRKKHVCEGCNRGLSDAELVEFEKFCKSQQERAPAKLKEETEELRGWEAQLASLKRLLPVEVAYNKLVRDDIPAAEKAATMYSTKLPGAKTKAEEAGKRTTDLKNQLSDLQGLKKAAGDVMRMHRECEDVARDIVRLESELSASGSTATSDDIQAQLAELNDQVRAIKVATEKIRNEQQKQNSLVQSLSESIHSNEMELQSKRQELREKEALEKQKETARDEIVDHEKELKDLEVKIRDSAAPLRKLEAELSQLRHEFTQAEATASRQLQSYNKSSEQLELNAREIKSYTSRGTAAELAKCEHDLKKHEQVITETKARINDFQNKIAKHDKDLSESATILRNFEDNLRLRKARRDIEKIDNDITSLDEEGARKASRKFDLDYNDRRRRHSEKQAQQAKLGGEIEMMKADLDSKREEMTSEYDNIENKYKTELIKVKTAEVANDDLDKYGKALDSAIMSFHGHKMKEINDTIADLWVKTYQGVDIDKIMIKSDAEGKGVGGRSYNYRVVMIKDKTEMDMRGRCSAGQKVLASIIIRLALAESFGTNCGILALDEPTTNLDKDNIEALAASLSGLIKERRGQSNFQLIVITHDEDFLQTLGGSGALDKYWRISRGDGGQVSTISRQRLN